MFVKAVYLVAVCHQQNHHLWSYSSRHALLAKVRTHLFVWTVDTPYFIYPHHMAASFHALHFLPHNKLFIRNIFSPLFLLAKDMLLYNYFTLVNIYILLWFAHH